MNRLLSLHDTDEANRVNQYLLHSPSMNKFLDGRALSVPCQRAAKAPVGRMLVGEDGADHLLAIGQAAEAMVVPQS